ncbi:MAG: hypothetical protein LBI74_00765 [Synergistaceae bacterium]|jgi:hypothetical protein|nr:hypothetical protein [Synergistaceae bacterium]
MELQICSGQGSTERGLAIVKLLSSLSAESPDIAKIIHKARSLGRQID